MFNRKRQERPKKDNANRDLSQYGIFLPEYSVENGSNDMDDDDDDLEAELLALTGDSKPKPRPKPKPAVPPAELDKMVAASLKDIASDEELSGDEDDPSLLDELNEITGNDVQSKPIVEEKEEETQSGSSDMLTLLENRLKMYKLAEENAKKTGESSRARRFNRGFKTLQDLIKHFNAGKAINPDDIPPEVSVNIPKKPPVLPPAASDNSPENVNNDNSNLEPIENIVSPTAASENIPDASTDPTSSKVETKNIDQNLLKTLTERKLQYKIAALNAKKSGDVQTAINYMKIAKQFDVVITAVENGDPVDLSNMPGPPGDSNVGGANSGEEDTVKNTGKEENETQQQGENEAEEEIEEAEIQLITAGSVLEALEQRLDVYKKQESAAKEEGNSSKARRMGRIVKQFEQAIKQHKSGKPIPFEDLPTPPGYAPIPGTTAATPSQPSATPQSAASTNQPALASSTPSDQPSASPPKPPPRTNSARKLGNQTSNNRIEKLVALLLARQKEFKEAALQAKRKGEIEQAKELLRSAKGFDKVIDAARGGFPVDMDSLPVPASARSVLDESFEVIIAEECKEDDTGTLEMLTRLEEQLTKQLKMCLSTRDHHKALGDVTGVNRFENLALSVTKDLDIVRLAYRRGDDVPTFRYEQKSFSIVKCFTDLNDNDLELIIVRGINFNCSNPKEIDTYVKVEFPFPQEEPYKERTAVIKDTNNPEYNANYTIPIQRTSRQCLRVFKRHSVKLEVFSRGCCISDWPCCFSGFFRSDQLIGTTTIKLQALETQCELHDSFDLMDGRKKAGGKLEVRIRVRHPLVARQVEQINEKWLVLTH